MDQKPEPSSEPYEYSAVIVRSIAGSSTRTLSETRIARLGELRREDWTESGHRFALIWRPDIERSYLLDLENSSYTEDLINHPSSTTPDDEADYFEHEIDEMPQPERVETQELPERTIDGRLCSGFETRLFYDDGRTEIQRSFRAKDLGIAVRTEVEQSGGLLLITERKDISTSVPKDLFEIPATFHKTTQIETKRQRP